MALSISCKSNEEPQETGTTTSNHPSQGTYNSVLYGTGSSATVTINNDGTCTITGTAYNYFDTNDAQTFSITITTWYQYYNDPVAYAGINGYGTEKSEVTINSPTTDYFMVKYDGRLDITFGPDGRYMTGYLTNQ
ncbi:hypothetical protein EZH24_13085 [Brachyspira catarrhinii]|uniref:Lipocalin-like domain-containing protein n=2 Tax=Brachyspira catarrhinii TaxID=2528966 RepID=A0ABY2TM29_9SPIR|nr:hypothetical protein EZH24_13085 [Brachyspira catarrhinii]